MNLLYRLLRFPTFYKILLANSLIVTVSVFVGFQVGISHAQEVAGDPDWDVILVFTLIGVGIVTAFGVNFLVLKAALLPISVLQNAVRRVQNGDLGTRVDKVTVSDPSLDNLIDAFNAMLDRVELNQKQSQMLSGQILQAQEEERKRIARELHDETAQALTALLVRLRLLAKAGTLEDARSRVSELRELTARALEEVRRIALELRSSLLDDLGLVAALGSYVDEYNNRYNIRASLECSGINKRLPNQTELALYRVVQEALTNVARHSGATNVWVRLQLQDYGLVDLSVEDDGHGFDVETVLSRRDGGLGLFGMRERIALLGGEFWIDSAPGKHTIIGARIPVMSVVGLS